MVFGLRILTLVWAFSACGLFIFYVDLVNMLWIGALLLKGIVLLLGVMILIVSICAVRNSYKTAAFCGITAIVGIVGFLTIGFDLGQRVRFGIVRHYYEQQVSAILNPTTSSVVPTTAHLIEPGPPVRVAFYWQRSGADNWIGLVFDPSGGVMDANHFRNDWSNWEDPQLAWVKRLFGGDMYRARKLDTNWYLCWFT